MRSAPRSASPRLIDILAEIAAGGSTEPIRPRTACPRPEGERRITYAFSRGGAEQVIETTRGRGLTNPLRVSTVRADAHIRSADILHRGLATILTPGPRPRNARPPEQNRPRRKRATIRGASRRASARSGDSGDDPPGEPRLCACGCGRSLQGRRSHCRVATNACQQRLQAQQHADDASRAARSTSAIRWIATLATAAEIHEIEVAIRDRRLNADTGRRLIDLLAARRLRALRQATPTACRHQTIECDEDGDPVCVHCGQLVGTVQTRINGYDATAALMARNGIDTDPTDRFAYWWRLAGISG